MSRFTTRVELYGSPNADDYNKLHYSMQRYGFARNFVGGDITYILPHAEYSLNSNNTTKEVLELAKEAAHTVWKDYSVLVTRTEVTREWYNLKVLKN